MILDNTKKILSSNVLIVALGGLGCPAAEFLTRAGIGTIGIIDNDKVSISNIHRQSFFTSKDVGKLTGWVLKNYDDSEPIILSTSEEISIKELEKTIKNYFDEYGFPKSRNPEDVFNCLKYLILIAYCLGLAIGIHLLNLLAIPFIALIIYFKSIQKISFYKTNKRFDY